MMMMRVMLMLQLLVDGLATVFVVIQQPVKISLLEERICFAPKQSLGGEEKARERTRRE